MAVKPIPSPSVPVLNKDGTMAPVWYEFIKGISVSGLADVKLTALANGETLIWDSAQGKWVNAPN